MLNLLNPPFLVPWTKVQPFFDRAVQFALKSSCLRSKCGAILISAKGQEIGYGWNSPPNDLAPQQCMKDTLPSDFKSDKTCCVHAEQRAIINAIKNGSYLTGSRLYFVRLNAQNQIELSGAPYCTICSKMAIDCGVAEWCLYHRVDVWGKDGVYVYDAYSYNQYSFNNALIKKT